MIKGRPNKFLSVVKKSDALQFALTNKNLFDNTFPKLPLYKFIAKIKVYGENVYVNLKEIFLQRFSLMIPIIHLSRCGIKLSMELIITSD